jgi:GcrA cell cycle regulator
MSISWTDERIEQLKALLTEGLSSTAIAAEMGCGLTRNAIIGKVHRLGLVRPARPSRPAKPRAPRIRTATTRTRLSIQGLGQAVLLDAHSVPLPLETEIDIPIEQRRALLELTDETCKWPVGDPAAADFYFCGGAAEPGKPYCSAHCRIAFRPPHDRTPGQRANYEKYFEHVAAVATRSPAEEAA